MQTIITYLAESGSLERRAAARGAVQGVTSPSARSAKNRLAQDGWSSTGIPNQKLSKVFDTFYTTKEHGTGLGLSIARTVIQACGGKIWAENRAVGGAVFCFILPLINKA